MTCLPDPDYVPPLIEPPTAGNIFINLANLSNDYPPVIMAGSWFDMGGTRAFIKYNAQAHGLPVNGRNFIYAHTYANSDFILVYSSVTPVWSLDKEAWVNGYDRALVKFDFFFDSYSFSNKVVMDDPNSLFE
jgi:hypothetical protein